MRQFCSNISCLKLKFWLISLKHSIDKIIFPTAVHGTSSYPVTPVQYRTQESHCDTLVQTIHPYYYQVLLIILSKKIATTLIRATKYGLPNNFVSLISILLLLLKSPISASLHSPICNPLKATLAAERFFFPKCRSDHNCDTVIYNEKHTSSLPLFYCHGAS